MARDLPNEMVVAQGAEIDCDVGSEAAAVRFANLAACDVNAEEALSALQMARDAQNLRSDSAFGTRFCEVSDAETLDFEAAAAYINEHYDGFLSETQSAALAVATAAEGLGGMGGERAVIDAFDFLRDAGDEFEDDGIDAFTTSGRPVQMKRNSRERNSKRHHHWGLDEEVILCSWEVTEDGIRVGFETANEEWMSYGIASGDSP